MGFLTPPFLSVSYSSSLQYHKMPDTHKLTIYAPIKDTLDLIDAVRDKWTNDVLQSSEQWALNRWHQGARVAIHNYLLLLDNSDSSFDRYMRLYMSDARDDYDSFEKVDIKKRRRFPRHAYVGITSYLEGIMKDYESGHYQYPSAIVSIAAYRIVRDFTTDHRFLL